MAVGCLPFALLGACLACAQGFQRSLMEVVVPRRIPVDSSGNTDKMAFGIMIEGTVYTIRLKRQSLLSNDFRVYTYSSDGSLKSVAPTIERNCYYQGYIEDFVDSVVSLSSCMGLEGLLQFENATYGIEPVGNAAGFQHLVYQLKYENISRPTSAGNYFISWEAAMSAPKPVTEVLQSSLATMRYLEIYIVLAHDLYTFWGAVVNTVTEKIIRLIGFVNAFQKGITLENFSVRITQLLAFGLGIHFDNSSRCQCSGSTCVMNTSAILSGGSKFFSSCSLQDYQTFLQHGDVHCLFNKPRMDLQIRAAFCGNKIVEDGEQCDCGTEEQCKNHPCCDTNCKLKHGKVCADGACCWSKSCKLKPSGTLCRDSGDKDCDLKEFCNGTSAECTENLYMQDGQLCAGGSAVCMQGVCQSADLWCKKIFGKGSKNGSPQCYEEINSQKDRMGHCGSTAQGYQTCQWQDLRCGKLVCEYPSQKPFEIENAAIIYTRVQNRWCVTLDYMRGPGVKDPFLVHDGTDCGQNKVCMRQKCVDRSVIQLTCDARTKCNGKGVCNNKGTCNCNTGWAPPNCSKVQRSGTGENIDISFQGKSVGVPAKTRNWLLVTFLLFLPGTAGSIFLLMKLRAVYLGKEEDREDEYDYTTEGESETERSQGVNPSETETASV